MVEIFEGMSWLYNEEYQKEEGGYLGIMGTYDVSNFVGSTFPWIRAHAPMSASSLMSAPHFSLNFSNGRDKENLFLLPH